MGLLDKAKAAADQATTKVKESVDDVQAKRALSQAYEKLGQTAYELIAKGELTHAGLNAQADQIRVLRGEVADESPASAASTPASDTPPSDGPPADAV